MPRRREYLNIYLLLLGVLGLCLKVLWNGRDAAVEGKQLFNTRLDSEAAGFLRPVSVSGEDHLVMAVAAVVTVVPGQQIQTRPGKIDSEYFETQYLIFFSNTKYFLETVNIFGPT